MKKIIVSVSAVFLLCLLGFVLYLLQETPDVIERKLPPENTACIIDGGEYVQDQSICEAPANKTRLVSEQCWFQVGDDWPVTECYRMRAPENHDDPDGRYVNFPVVIFRADDLLTDIPVLHTGGGGPGSPMYMLKDDADKDLWNLYWSTSLEHGADLVIMDPRGLMDPLLMCDEYTRTIVDRLAVVETVEESIAKDHQIYKVCVDALQAKGIDLNQYNSIAISRDMDLLRKTLGYEAINVFGISYGTRYALTYARDFSQHANRLVLDGAVFNDVVATETSVKEEINAYRKAFTVCREDRHCNKKFPDIEARFWKLVSKLDTDPLMIKVTHPVNYSTVNMAVNGNAFRAVVFSALYDAGFAYMLPEIIASVENRNGDFLAGPAYDFLFYVLDEEYGDISASAHFCFEEYPFVDRDVLLENIEKYALTEKMGRDLLLYFDSFGPYCEMLGVSPGPVSEGEAITTDTPVLFLHGALDPVLPIDDVRERVSSFRRGQLIEFPQLSHSVVDSSWCAEMASGEFFYGDFDAEDFEDCRYY